MLKPKGADEPAVPDEVGMDDILRSIQGILDDAPEPQVTFPKPEASANDRPVKVAGSDGPPLSFLRRKRAPETIEPVLTTPAMPSLEERLERHRAKADAERRALRALAERATAQSRPAEEVGHETPSTPAAADRESIETTSPKEAPRSEVELDIFAEGEDLIEPPQAQPAPRARRMNLPQIETEEVDYSGGPARVEVIAHPAPTASLDETFEDIARSMLAERADDMDGVLADMMRPLVREWLDDNLSGIVERVVREEIERVSRGGR